MKVYIIRYKTVSYLPDDEPLEVYKSREKAEEVLRELNSRPQPSTISGYEIEEYEVIE
jgi:hypothetical protein